MIAPPSAGPKTAERWKPPVFQVTAREEADLSRLESERERLAEDLLNRKRVLTWGIFRESLKKRLVEEKELKLNQAAINRLIEGR